MMELTDEHYDAAYEAYYKAVNDFIVEQRGRVYLVSRRPSSFEVGEVSYDHEVAWQFEDKITADRFLIVKILEVITKAILEV